MQQWRAAAACQCGNGGRRLDRGAAMPGGGWLVGAARAGGGEARGLRDPEDDAEPDHPRPGSRRWHWRRRGDGPRSGRRRTKSITCFFYCHVGHTMAPTHPHCFFWKNTYGPTDMWAKEGASTPHQHEHNP